MACFIFQCDISVTLLTVTSQKCFPQDGHAHDDVAAMMFTYPSTEPIRRLSLPRFWRMRIPQQEMPPTPGRFGDVANQESVFS